MSNEYCEFEYLVDDFSDIENPPPTQTSFSWTRAATLLFIDEYDKRKERFRDPKLKKKTLWREISIAMRDAGMEVPNEDCLDRKMRNMKKTYKHIKNNNKKTATGRGRISWEFFDRFEGIFENDVTINLGESISSMASQDEETNETDDGSASGVSEGTSTPTCNTRNPRKRPSGLHYMRQKQIALDEQKIQSVNELSAQLAKINETLKRKNELIEKKMNYLRNICNLRNKK